MRVAAEHEAYVQSRLSPTEHRQLVAMLQRLADEGHQLDVHPGLRSD